MAQRKSRIIGHDYLATHPGMEKVLSIPEDHVIVHRKDLNEVIRFFRSNPEIFAEFQKDLVIKVDLQNKVNN